MRRRSAQHMRGLEWLDLARPTVVPSHARHIVHDSREGSAHRGLWPQQRQQHEDHDRGDGAERRRQPECPGRTTRWCAHWARCQAAPRLISQAMTNTGHSTMPTARSTGMDTSAATMAAIRKTSAERNGVIVPVRRQAIPSIPWQRLDPGVDQGDHVRRPKEALCRIAPCSTHPALREPQPSMAAALHDNQPGAKSFRISPTPLGEISKPSGVPGLITTP